MKLDIPSLFTRYCVGPAWAWWEKSPYLRHYRQLKKTQFASPQEVERQQWEKLSKIIAHAYATTEFYRGRFDQSDTHPNQIKSAIDLQKISLLTKQDLQQYQSRLISKSYERQSLHHKKTSGSTGTSVEVCVDEQAQQFKRGCTLRADEWSGWRFGERVAKVWGNPEYIKNGWRGLLRNALLDRAIYLDTLNMDDEAMHRFASTLQRRPPSLIFGHAHSIFLFACYLQQTGITDIRPRGIISSAMVLLDNERKVIEEVFDCPVTNRYGCEEVSLIASECEQHQGLHINADGIFVEILRQDGSTVEPGETGRVIVTDLVNYAMPIIRYQVGDMATLSPRQCPCGRGLPLLERIEGRTADYVVTRAGSQISGISLTENFAMLVPGIAQLQIVQEDYENFLFRIVKGPEFNAGSEEKIKKLVQQRFGNEAKYQLHFVDGIPQEPSGKYRFCISKVANPLTTIHQEVSTV